jgi:hypothetical protein
MSLANTGGGRHLNTPDRALERTTVSRESKGLQAAPVAIDPV